MPCVDGSELARASSRMQRWSVQPCVRRGFGAASFHLSYAHWQAYICPSSSLVMVPGLHPDGVARLVVIPPAVAVPGAARVVGPHCVVRGATN